MCVFHCRSRPWWTLIRVMLGSCQLAGLRLFRRCLFFPCGFAQSLCGRGYSDFGRKSVTVVSVSSECLGKLHRILNSIHMVLYTFPNTHHLTCFCCSFVWKFLPQNGMFFQCDTNVMHYAQSKRISQSIDGVLGKLNVTYFIYQYAVCGVWRRWIMLH